MKKRIGVTLLLAIGMQFFMHAQTDSIKRNAVFIAPFNLVDNVNPSVQVGYERLLTEKLSVQVEGAYIFKQSLCWYLQNNTNKYEYYSNGGKIRCELKYFLFAKGVKRYISCELFYSKNKKKELENESVTDIINIRRVGINLKFGTKIFLGNYLFIEPYIGIGLVNRKSDESNSDMNIDGIFSLNPNSSGGDRWFINFPINMKLGFQF